MRTATFTAVAAIMLCAHATLAIAAPSTVTRAYGPGHAGAIPDNDAVGFISPIEIRDSFPIQSIAVRITGLTHGYSSDLTLELRHIGVGAPTTLLVNLRNGSSADFAGDYVFADSGADLWAAANGLSGLQVIPPGTYRAHGAAGALVNLNARYVGENARGVWALRIVDDDFLVAGSFTGWELELGGAPACVSGGTGDLNGDSVVDAADLATLLGSWGPCAQP